VRRKAKLPFKFYAEPRAGIPKDAHNLRTPSQKYEAGEALGCGQIA